MTTELSFSGKRALVTGASGFIGSALARRLAQLGAQVHGVSRQSQPADEYVTRWWQCPLEQIDSVRAMLADVKPDLIFHLASTPVGARALELVLPLFHSNLHSTVNLLTAATEHGCERILLTGSLEEPNVGPDWPVPSSPYAASKFAAATYGRMFHALFNSPIINMRVFMVYGPGQKDLKKLIPYVTLALLKGEHPQLSSGVREVDWIYVDDVVEGYLAAAVAPGAEGSTVDIGTGRLHSVRIVAEELFKLINPNLKPTFGSVAERPMEQVRAANADESFRRIGWRAQVDLREGLSRTVDWYRDKLERGLV